MSGLQLEDIEIMSTHAHLIAQVATKSERGLERHFNTIRSRQELETLKSPNELLRPKSPQQKAIDRFKWLEQKMFEQSEEATRKKAAEYSALLNMNQTELLSQHRVLMIRVGYDEKADDNYFQECVQLVQSKTSSIRFVMNNIKETTESHQRMQTITSFLWNWIPNTIIGYFRSPLYWLRSFITAISCYRHHRCFKPTLIFVDAHPVAIPLLKRCFSCPVVSFAYYQNVLPSNNLAQILPVQQTPKSFNNSYLKYADQVFVPSMAIGQNCYKDMKRVTKFPIVFYPPVKGDTVDGERFTPRPSIMMGPNYTEPITILFIGQWCSIINFDLAMISLQDFFFDLDETQRERMKFVLIGFLEPNDKKGIECRRVIINNMKDLEGGFRKHLWYCTNPKAEYLWKLYRDCIGVLYFSDDDDFSWPLLVCQYFGRPVISLKNPSPEK